jgi:cephalosporin hydroxylase
MVTLSQYKFALAYENLANTRGYVTEKIFDALAAQTVPIYWGASNIEEYVDTNAFVDRRRFKNDAELALYLKGMTEKEHETMIEAGQRYLASDRFKKFLSEYFCDRIIEVLNISPIKQ